MVLTTRASGSVTARTLFAVVLIALGVLWTLDSLDLIESEPILRWWPVVLVLFGLMRLFGVGGRTSIGVGALFTLAGAWLLGGNLGFIRIGLFDLWPLILVVIGASMILRTRERLRAPGSGDPSRDVESFAVWSGVHRKVTAQDFRGGELSAVMGGVEIDLRSAKITQNPAVIDVFVIWGGIDLRVPEDWKVVLESFVALGGIDDKTKAPPADATQTLVIKGLVVMGGIDIKN
jgi:predicted membrane protein